MVSLIDCIQSHEIIPNWIRRTADQINLTCGTLAAGSFQNSCIELYKKRENPRNRLDHHHIPDIQIRLLFVLPNMGIIQEIMIFRQPNVEWYEAQEDNTKMTRKQDRTALGVITIGCRNVIVIHRWVEPAAFCKDNAITFNAIIIFTVGEFSWTRAKRRIWIEYVRFWIQEHIHSWMRRFEIISMGSWTWLRDLVFPT